MYHSLTKWSVESVLLLVAVSHLYVVQVKAKKEPVMSCAPIVRALLMLDESEKRRKTCKYDLCYLGIAFEK